MKVFISHSSSDKWVARQVAAQLGARGVESFLDEKDIKTGDRIDDTIQTHLADCDEFLIILSPASLRSTWVFIEIGGAQALRKRLVPILLHVGPNDLPDPLRAGLARDINEIERYYEELEARSGESAEKRERDAREALAEAEAEAELDAGGARDFAVGDRVQLPPAPPPSESLYGRDGTYIGWSQIMERYLGKQATVVAVHEPSGTVKVDLDRTWHWLMDWLTPADDGAEPAGASGP